MKIDGNLEVEMGCYDGLMGSMAMLLSAVIVWRVSVQLLVW